MSDQSANKPAADANAQPASRGAAASGGEKIGVPLNPHFRLENTLIKNLSLEIPESVVTPVFNKEPTVNLEIRHSARALSREHYMEVLLEATARVRNGDDLQVLIEVSQSGIFFIQHEQADARRFLTNVQAPEMLYPYLSQVVSDLMSRAGAPRIFLPPFDFKRVYETKRAAQRKQLLASGGEQGDAKA